MLKKISAFTFLLCIGLLLLNNGFTFNFSASFVNLLRDLAGLCALILAVVLALE